MVSCRERDRQSKSIPIESYPQRQFPGYRKDILNNYFKHIAAERSNSAAPKCADGPHALLSFFPAQTIIPDLRFAFQK